MPNRVHKIHAQATFLITTQPLISLELVADFFSSDLLQDYLGIS